jgi:hypothetical protein
MANHDVDSHQRAMAHPAHPLDHARIASLASCHSTVRPHEEPLSGVARRFLEVQWWKGMHFSCKPRTGRRGNPDAVVLSIIWASPYDPRARTGERQSGPRAITGYGAGPSSRRGGAICVGDGDRRSPFPWIGACGICLGTFRSTSQRTSVFAGNVEAGEIVEVGLPETGRPQILLRFTRS